MVPFTDRKYHDLDHLDDINHIDHMDNIYIMYLWGGSPLAGYFFFRWILWRHTEVGYVRNRTLEGQRLGNTLECPRGARMVVKGYSHDEAVRSRE